MDHWSLPKKWHFTAHANGYLICRTQQPLRHIICLTKLEAADLALPIQSGAFNTKYLRLQTCLETGKRGISTCLEMYVPILLPTRCSLGHPLKLMQVIVQSTSKIYTVLSPGKFLEEKKPAVVGWSLTIPFYRSQWSELAHISLTQITEFSANCRNHNEAAEALRNGHCTFACVCKETRKE